MTTNATRSTSSKGLLTHLTVAGTAALAASNAGAQILVTPVNVDIGYGPGGQTSFTSSLPGLSQFIIGRFNSSLTHGIFMSGEQKANSYLVFHTTRVNGITPPVNSPAGQKYSSAPGAASTAASIARVRPNGTAQGYAPFTDGYFLFKFKDTTNGNQIDYGYVQASLTSNTFNGLNLHITSYAYDASGAQIAAGAQPAAAVPEPGAALAFAALGALTLGAAGVRRMKALQA